MVKPRSLPKFPAHFTNRRTLGVAIGCAALGVFVTMPIMSGGHKWDCAIYQCPAEMYRDGFWMTVFRVLVIIIMAWTSLSLWLEMRAKRVMDYRREISTDRVSSVAINKEAGTFPRLGEYAGMAGIAYGGAVILKIMRLSELGDLVIPGFIVSSVIYAVTEHRSLKAWRPRR